MAKDSKYRRKDVCEEIHKAVDTRFVEAEKDISCATKSVVLLDKRLTRLQISSLIFTIITLVTLILALATGRV